MTAFTDSFQRAAIIAGRQHGAIGSRQAVSAGLSEHQIRGLVDRGVWQRRVRGVYVVAGSADAPSQRLMVAFLAAGPSGGVISHMSAAAEHGLLRHPPLPHLTVPPKSSAGARTARVHRGVVPEADRTRKGPLVVTTVPRTIVDCAALLDRPTVEAMVDAAFCRKLADRAAVHAAADRIGPGRRGIALARSATAVWLPTIEPGSPAEMRALRCLGELGLVGLVPQHEVFDQDGGFVARLDLAIPEDRRGFEYDGVEFHNPRQWDRDERRYRRLHTLGWEIESLSKLDLLPGEARLRSIVARWTAIDRPASCERQRSA